MCQNYYSVFQLTTNNGHYNSRKQLPKNTVAANVCYFRALSKSDYIRTQATRLKSIEAAAICSCCNVIFGSPSGCHGCQPISTFSMQCSPDFPSSPESHLGFPSIIPLGVLKPSEGHLQKY
jgi:hypothetical protein